MAAELQQFIEKEHTVMREADLAGAGPGCLGGLGRFADQVASAAGNTNSKIANESTTPMAE